MSEKFLPYKPILPPEALYFLGREAKDWEWYPYPSRGFWKPPREDVQILDYSDQILALAEDSRLRGHLGAIDLTVGCRWPCQTCVRDSPNLSSTTTLEAMAKLTGSQVFRKLIPEWSVCIGYASEPSDSPDILAIMNLMLEATSDRQQGFRISLKTNYRRQKEDTSLQLMTLANQSERMVLTISLPLNRDNKIQEDFLRFKQQHTDLFRNRRIIIFDLKNPLWQKIENIGRVLPEATNPSFADPELFQTRGKGGLLINSEGLWFMVNTTPYEAHTPEIYTLVTA